MGRYCQRFPHIYPSDYPALPLGSETIIQEFAQRQIIWNYALGESLRKLPFSDRVQDYLIDHRIEATNIPNALLDEHSLQLKQLADKGLISEFRLIQLNETLARLCDSMGKCERIKNTVFPRSYSILVHSLIYVFAAILPFGFDDSQLSLLIIEIGITIRSLPSLSRLKNSYYHAGSV